MRLVATTLASVGLLSLAQPATAQPAEIIPGFPTAIPTFADDFEFYCWAKPWLDKVHALPRDKAMAWSEMSGSTPEQRRMVRRAAVLEIDWYQKPEAKVAARKGRQCNWEVAAAAPPAPSPNTIATLDNLPLAVPRGNPATWVTPNDYPTSAIRDRLHGVTRYLLHVGPDGRVKQCHIRQSSGHKILDDQACNLSMLRARFNAPRDQRGNPTEAVFLVGVTWVAPPQN